MLKYSIEFQHKDVNIDDFQTDIRNVKNRKFRAGNKNVKLVTQYLKSSLRQKQSSKKALLGLSQNSQENTCARVSFLIKLQA